MPEGKVAGVCDRFDAVTTLHGPCHAAQTSSKSAKFLWRLVGLIGLILASFQGIQIMNNYFNDETNSITISKAVGVDSLSEKQYFMACHTSWLDHDLIKAKGIKYRHVLYALSLIESLNPAVLDEIESMDIPDDEKIWGIRDSSCREQQRRKKRATDTIDDIKNAIDLGELESVVAKAGQLMAMCKPCQRNLTHMANWDSHAVTFRDEIGSNYETLTDFLADIARKPNLFDKVGEREGWRVALGQLCEVIMVDHKVDKDGVTTDGQSVTMAIGLTLGNGTLADLLSRPEESAKGGAFLMVPYVTESVYSKAGVTDPAVKRVTQGMAAMFDPDKIIGTVTGGVQLSFGIQYGKVVKLTRDTGCTTPVGSVRQPHQEAAMNECRRKCYKSAEEKRSSYHIVTGNDVGDIPIKDVLVAPGQVVQPTLPQDQAATCMYEEQCASQRYCEEWKFEDAEVVEMTDITEGLSCGTPDILSTMGVRIHLAKGYLVEATGRIQLCDIIGLVGGILGLYIGASLITILHTIWFAIDTVFQGCKGIVA